MRPPMDAGPNVTNGAAAASGTADMHIVPARQGFAWLALGWQLFKKQPMPWLALVALYWFVVALLNLAPYAGSVISTLLLPAFSVSFMNISAAVEAGNTPTVSMVWSGFQQRLSGLVALGGVYLVTALACLGVAARVDDGVMFNWIVWGNAPSKANAEDGSLIRGMLAVSLAGTPVLMANWFAPALIAWRGLGAIQALFYSFFASLRNWRAFLMYVAAVMFFGMMLMVALAIFAVAARGYPALLRGVMLCLTIFVMPTLFASFYVGYRDVFPAGGRAAAPAPRPSDTPPDSPRDISSS